MAGLAAPVELQEEIIHRVELKKHVEVLPGTEIMTDVSGVHLVHAHNATSSVVLVPQPTQDPHDPLNWTRMWKLGIMINQGCFVLLSVIGNLSIAPLTPIYMAEWHKSLSQVALLTGAVVISLGYANFMIIPCSDIFGRRIVTLVCALICLGANIWQATANSYGSFLGARVFNGLGAAANESIMTVVVADIFFLHQRGRYIGVYFWCYFVGLFLGPIISGSIAAHTSWRWFFWACTIAQGINFATMALFFPETRRLAKAEVVLDVPATEKFDPISTANPEKPLVTSDYHKESSAGSSEEHGITVDDCLGRGKPSKSQFGIFQPADREALRKVFLHIVTPIQIFFFPIVFWASMSMGAAANALLDVNLTQSQAFAAPPYNFNPGSVGYANFALVVGGILGLSVAGPFSDWIAMRATKENGGIRKPEMRLPSLIPFIAAALVGLTVVGVGYQYKWPWEAIIIIGFGLVGVQVVAIPTITITTGSGPIMVIATVTKNTFGFGMTYYINDWAAKSGFIPPLMLLMAMTVGFSLIGMIFLMFFGKTMRRWTKNAALHHF